MKGAIDQALARFRGAPKNNRAGAVAEEDAASAVFAAVFAFSEFEYSASIEARISFAWSMRANMLCCPSIIGLATEAIISAP